MTERSLICVIEDDAMLRRSLEDLLTSLGHAVAVFSTAEAFLETHVPAGCACVVSDIRMPGIGGLGLIRRLSARSDAPPVLLISAHATEAIRAEAVRFGVFAVLQKPFDPAQLLETINAALDQRKR